MTVAHAQALFHHLWKWLWHSHAIVPLVSIPLLILLIQMDTPVTEQSKVCDRAIDMLFNSRDLIEVQRAGILIDNIGCSVSKRLPRP